MHSNSVRRSATFLLAALLVLFAATSPAQQPALPASAAHPAQTQLQPAAAEVAVLKAQLATMQSFTDGLLATVHWSLGGVVVVAGLLVGFGWFSTLRLHDREIAALRNELAASLSAQSRATREALEAAATTKLDELTKSAKEDLSRTSEEKIDALKASLSHLAATLENLQTRTSFAAFQSEAWYWEVRGIRGNELTQYINILGLAVHESNSLRISQSLKRIEELLTAGTQVMPATITGIVKLLDSLPPEQSIHAEALRTALRAAKTY